MDRRHQRLLRPAVFLGGPPEYLRGGDPLLLDRREAPGEHRLRDGRRRHAHVQRVGRCPLAGPLLTRRVENDVDERLAGDGVPLPEDVRRDLD